MSKIKLLFFSNDSKSLSNYYRIQSPMIQLMISNPDDFEVDIMHNTDKFPETEDLIDFLSDFQIVHYHGTILQDLVENEMMIHALQKKGVKFIYDVDSHWEFSSNIDTNLGEFIISNAKQADHVTVSQSGTGGLMKYNLNISIIPNAVNPSWMRQFKSNNRFDREIPTVGFISGPGHLQDLELLRGTTNLLWSSSSTKETCRILLGGFTLDGNVKESTVNPKMIDVLQKLNLYNQSVINQLKRNNNDITKVDSIPEPIKALFKGSEIVYNNRKAKPFETDHALYERLLTDNMRVVGNDKKYLNYLKKYTKEKYVHENEVFYLRRWSTQAQDYVKVLDEVDILLAPMCDTPANKMSSDLKFIEAMSRKLPVIASDMGIYNSDGLNEKNSILIPYKKNSSKEWARAIKKLASDKNLREDLGHQLYEDLNNQYDLIKVNEKRISLYKSLI